MKVFRAWPALDWGTSSGSGCRWRRIRTPALLIALVTTSWMACAPAPPPRVPAQPRFPEFAFPFVPADLVKAGRPVRSHEAGWAYLQSGDLRRAEREFAVALKTSPGFYPAQVATGYVSLARRDYREALDRFDAVMQRASQYTPALLGRGEALLGLGQDAEALAAFEAALAADGSLADVRRRVEVLRFRGQQEALASAQAAARAGRLEEARASYGRAIAASPDSGFLYRELAGVERRLGLLDEAAGHAEQASGRDPGDSAALLLLGEIHEERGDWDAAIAALEKARAIEASPGLDARIESLRERTALARLPDEYRAIPGSPRVTRGDLAALLGVRLGGFVLAASRRQPVLVTDARGHWAQPWIGDVARAGFMEVFANHTFQPRAVVRRSDLAQAVSRVLAAISARDPVAAQAWKNARVKFADVGPGHLAYRAASAAVAAGVMHADDGVFRPSRPISGAEAVEAVSRLEALAPRPVAKQGPLQP